MGLVPEPSIGEKSPAKILSRFLPTFGRWNLDWHWLRLATTVTTRVALRCTLRCRVIRLNDSSPTITSDRWPLTIVTTDQSLLDHQQKGELHTLDCGDDKSTQKFQPHSINSKVFWRLLCTQNDSNSLVYSYNYLTYYNVFFMNCLVYATISTAFL